MKSFKAKIEIIGVTPYVPVPDKILQYIFSRVGSVKGNIPILGTVNGVEYKQTLVRFGGAWRLYINTKMLKNSPQRIGETIDISIDYDPVKREILPPPKFKEALKHHADAQSVFDHLRPSLRLEIVRYLSQLKTEQSLERNITRAINFLLGKERFIGRDGLK